MLMQQQMKGVCCGKQLLTDLSVYLLTVLSISHYVGEINEALALHYVIRAGPQFG